VGIALLGAHDGVHQCRNCKRNHIGGRPKKCECGAQDYSCFVKTRTLDDYEKLACEVCDECKKEQEMLRAEVAAGGIYWKCSDCRQNGVIKASAELSGMVRKQLKVDAPDPCGVEFSKKDCPAGCSKDGAVDGH
jgi:hypothetical protein